MIDLSLDNSNNGLKEIVSLLNTENKPLQSDEIAHKLNKDTKQVLRILWNRTCQGTVKIVVKKNKSNCICRPSYELEKRVNQQ